MESMPSKWTYAPVEEDEKNADDASNVGEKSPKREWSPLVS